MATSSPDNVAKVTDSIRQLTAEIRQDRLEREAGLDEISELWRGIAARARMLTAMRQDNWPPKAEEHER